MAEILRNEHLDVDQGLEVLSQSKESDLRNEDMPPLNGYLVGDKARVSLP